MIDVSKHRHSNPLYYLKHFRVMYAANKNKFVSIKPFPAKIFFLEMSSAFVCCIYSNALQPSSYHGSKHYEP